MTSAGGGHVSVDEVKEGGASLSPGFVSIDGQRLEWWDRQPPFPRQEWWLVTKNTGMVLRSNAE